MSEMTAKPIGNPVYRTARFATEYLNVPPNMHRLRNAVGLMAGLYAGRIMMNVLVGQKPDGTAVDSEYLPGPLKSLHGILAYDHFSDNPKDRWMKVFDQMVPGAVGAFGAAAGSVSFFRSLPTGMIESKLNLSANKFTIAAAEQTALALQSKPWSLMSAISSVFGSASGFGLFPSPLNYSETLGATFTMRAERTPIAPWLGVKGQKMLLNAHSRFPFRAPRLVARAVEYVVGNKTATPEMLEEYVRGILLPMFDGLKEADLKAFADEILRQREAFQKSGMSLADVETAIKQSKEEIVRKSGLTLMTGHGFEEALIKAGIDPRRAHVGDMGFISRLGNLVGDTLGFGTTKKITSTHEHLRAGLEARHGAALKAKFGDAPFIPPAHTDPHGLAQKLAMGSVVGAGAAGLGLIAMSKDTVMTDLHPDSPDTKAQALEHGKNFSDRLSTKPHVVHSKKKHGPLNGKILDTAEGISGMLNASIGLHRVSCAAGLTIGSMLGDKVMEALTGQSFAGKTVAKDKLWKPLQPLHGKLAFNPHSDASHDKWMQVLRWGIPGIIGAIGVIEGSRLFFVDQHKNDHKVKYLDEAENAATHKQSEPWTYTAAITSLFGFPSGLPMLPLVNYSTNLGTRYSMASGRKVALPVVGKLWSNNSTLFPFGPPGMLDLMIKEAVNNKSYDPELLETYAIGVLKPWFKNVTPHQIENFVTHIHEVRDKFFKEGGVPEDLKEQLEAELKAHLHGAGLEDTLRDIGLDPLKATLANNGLSGSIANILGAKKDVGKVRAEYTQAYLERQKSKETEQDKGPAL